MSRFVDEVKRLLHIRSTSPEGNEEAINYISFLMQAAGFLVKTQKVTHSFEDVSRRQFNIIGILGTPLVDKKIRTGLLLVTHLDTIGHGIKEHWSATGGDPLAATIQDGKIFGLGSADAKLDLICKLYAAQRFREKKLKMPVYVVGTCGEELGMFGCKYLLESMALNPKYAVVGKPTSLKVGHAHKGLHVISASIGFQTIERGARGFNRRINLFSYGKCAHSSNPAGGKNAILRLVWFLKTALDNGFEIRFTKLEGGSAVNQIPDRATAEFYLTSHQLEDFKRFFREVTQKEDCNEGDFKIELGGVGDVGISFLPETLFPCLTEVLGFIENFSEELKTVTDAEFDPPVSTVNIGMFKHRPGKIEMLFEVRALPSFPEEKIVEMIKKGQEVIAVQYPSLIIDFERIRANPALSLPNDHDLVRLCGEAMSEAGLMPNLDKFSFSSEAGLFYRAGYDAVVFGPGLFQGNIHSADEYNSMDELQSAISFYEKLIEKVCL